MATCAIPVIDPDVKYVGISKLRDLNASKLKHSQETTYVLQENDQPLAVLLSFEKYLIIQRELNSLMSTLEMLQDTQEREGVMDGLRDIAAGRTRSIAEVRASLKKNGSSKE
jgi:PHD/YefM family antitoxin component YafN of YafNO toxin-antitoxin module